MRPLRSLLIYAVAVFVGGALIAPWLWWAVQQAAPASALAHDPFHRYVNRALEGAALVGIWPLLRSLKAASFRDLGLVKPAGQSGRLAAGLALGFGSLACVAAIALAAHGRVPDSSLGPAVLASKLAGAVLTAVLTAVLEEILFRGAIFGSLRHAWDWRLALLASSMIYAILHFLRQADLPGPIRWDSGLRTLPLMLAGFADPAAVIPGFFSLTLAGIILGLAYQRTGNLYFSIGVHAGWIFWLKSYNLFTRPAAGAPLWFFGTNKLTDGWLALAVLAVTLPVMLLIPAIRANKPQA
jgi:membrane protease YdiL (CAAX protease family)